jgi:recombination protein RecT
MVTTAANKSEANGSTAIVKIDEKTVCNVQQLKGLFDNALPLLQKALPATMKRNAERLARCAVTEFQKNPELMKCTGLSILSCAVQAAQLGLEIGGVMGQSYMVPYSGRATFQIGYRGMIELAFRSGHVANVYGSVVREKDKFRMLRGTSQGIEHEPCTVAAGKMIGAYAVVVYKSNQINFVWMDRADIEHHRDTYSKTAGNPRGPWATAFNEMAIKTVIRKLLKQCPFAAEFPQAVFQETEDDPATTLTITADSLPVPAQIEGGAEVVEETATEPDKPASKDEEKAAEKSEEKKEDPLEVTDEKAFLALIDKTKLTWANVLQKIGTQFKVDVDQATPFEEIPLDHRRWAVGELQKAAAAPKAGKGKGAA